MYRRAWVISNQGWVIRSHEIESKYTHIHNSFTFSGGKDGTPLACAANKGHMDILNYLLGQNAIVNGNSQVSIQLL